MTRLVSIENFSCIMQNLCSERREIVQGSFIFHGKMVGLGIHWNYQLNQNSLPLLSRPPIDVWLRSVVCSTRREKNSRYKEKRRYFLTQILGFLYIVATVLDYLLIQSLILCSMVILPGLPSTYYIPITHPEEHKSFKILCHKLIKKMWFLCLNSY